MRTILVVNPKGGSGKTTLATNLAVHYALQGKEVALVDFDPQGSATDWLAERPEWRAPIHGVEAFHAPARVPRKTEYVIMDAPAASRGQALLDLVKRAETLVVPVIPSPLDLRAALRFHDELVSVGRLVRRQVKVITVANRVRENSPSRIMLEDSLRNLKLPNGRRLPFSTYLRQAQIYIRAAEKGLGIFELAPSTIGHEVELWQPLLRWLNSKHSIPA